MKYAEFLKITNRHARVKRARLVDFLVSFMPLSAITVLDTGGISFPLAPLCRYKSLEVFMKIISKYSMSNYVVDGILYVDFGYDRYDYGQKVKK